MGARAAGAHRALRPVGGRRQGREVLVTAGTLHDPAGPWNGRTVACLSAGGHTVPLRRREAGSQGGGQGDLSFACPAALRRVPAPMVVALEPACVVAIKVGFQVVAVTAADPSRRSGPAPLEWMAARGCIWDCAVAAAAARADRTFGIAWAADVLEAVCPGSAPSGPGRLRVVRPVALACATVDLRAAGCLGERSWPRPCLLTADGAAVAPLVLLMTDGMAWAVPRDQGSHDRLMGLCAAPEAGRRGP